MNTSKKMGFKIQSRWFFPLLLSSLVLGAELSGIQVPSQVTVGGKTLVLNGLGTRKATFLKVKVYVGSLFLEHRSSIPTEILGSNETKRVELVFLRNVDVGKIRNAWDEGLTKNCLRDCERFRQPLEVLKAQMRDFREGDRLDFDLSASQITVSVNGEKKVVASGEGFPEQFLKTWLGDHPADEDLKRDLLSSKVN